MGLDMYLTRKIYVGANYEWNNVTGTIDLKRKGTPLPIILNKVIEITQEGIYWRKANAIHKYFVEHVQDGEDDNKEYYVSREDLRELQKICKEIIDTVKIKNTPIDINNMYIKTVFDANKEDFEKQKEQTLIDIGTIYDYEDADITFDTKLAHEILPSCEGFFFGSTEYDKYYIYDILYTYLEIERLFEEDKMLSKDGIHSLNDVNGFGDFYYYANW